MKPLLRVILASLCLCTAAAARDSIDTDYKGPDAGVLVFSTSTLKGPMGFDFYYERASETRDPDSIYGAGVIECACVGFWHPTMSDPDYHSDYETGKVQIQHLPPGDYKVYTFMFGGFVPGVASYSYTPQRPLALPFTIKPGQTTYIGNFARAPSLGTPMESTVGAAGYFVVSDKHDRDIEIARKKDPKLPPVTVTVTDVAQFGSRALLDRDPYAPPAQ